MGNLGGLEILMILIVALVVLGPTKLPEAARQVGRAVNELRRISGGFQQEMREAMREVQEPLMEEVARARGDEVGKPRPMPAPGPMEAMSAPETRPDESAAEEAQAATAAATPSPPTEDDVQGAAADEHESQASTDDEPSEPPSTDA